LCIVKGGFVVGTGQKAASTKFIEGIREMCRDVKIGVKWKGTHILEEFGSSVGLGQGIAPAPFDIRGLTVKFTNSTW
jgi:hypothetical protein